MITAILQARMSSRRLPGKVLCTVMGRPLMALQLERLARARRIDRLIVATSDRDDDDGIATVAEGAGVECFRGSLDDVLDRVYRAARASNPRYVVRLTADCPLADPALIDAVIDFCECGDYDYASNALQPTFPDGLDVEVVRLACLEEAWRNAKLPSEREHVLPYVHTKPERYRIGVFRNDTDLSHLRWTVDEPEDLEFATLVFEALYPRNPAFSTEDILALIDRQPALARINQHHTRNSGSLTSAQKDVTFLQSGPDRSLT